MEGKDPMEGRAKYSGCLVAGYNAVACDYCAALGIGVDPDLIPSIRETFLINKFPLIDFKPEDVDLDSN